MRPYQNLKAEGYKDIDFFKSQLRSFQIMIAVRAFSDLKLCITLDEMIGTLKSLIKDCEAKQKYYERMDALEYKTYITKLCRDIQNPSGEEEQAGVTDTEFAEPERKVTWTA